MIKEKDLFPGNVITSITRQWSHDGDIITVTAWMVLGFEVQVKRRHSRTVAPRDGWEVLLIRFGDSGEVLRSANITPYSMQHDWKRLF